MHGPAIYVISALLFVLAGLLLFAAATAWGKVARHRHQDSGEGRNGASDPLGAAAGLTAAALVLLGAASLSAMTVFFFQI